MKPYSSTSNRPSKTPVTIIVGIVVIGVVLLVGIKALQIKTLMAAPFDMPPQVITAIAAKEDHWDSYINTVGSLEAKEGALITAETLGKVTAIHFQSGDMVKAGDPIITQDAASEQAQLRSAQATLQNTQTNLERGKKLIKDRSIAQSELDTLNEQYKLALAAVDNTQTQINKKTLRAPFAGQLGVRQVQLGAVVDRSDPIVTLQNTSSLYVNFLVPQAGIGKLQLGQQVRIFNPNAKPNDAPSIASINAISPEVSNTTRNVQVQATLPNADNLWRPGMFVDIQVVVASAQPVLIIPITAVAYAPYGNSVYLVEGDKLRQVFVQLGEQRGDFVVVNSGLKAGDQVASSGVFKLHNGQAVTVDNKLQPDFQLHPTPSDN
jgi:membrane fusion protein (multidrug efflux system)